MKVCVVCLEKVENSCKSCGSTDSLQTKDLFDKAKGINFICSRASSKEDRVALIKLLLADTPLEERQKIEQGDSFKAYAKAYAKKDILIEIA